MTIDIEMTDDQVAAQIERTDAFVATFRELIEAATIDPASPCADHHRRGIERISATLNEVPFVTFCNLANLDAALRGGLLDLIEIRLLAVGGGPALDFQDAAAFLAAFAPMIETARRRLLQ
jgi:hypothetical protein